MAFTLELAGQYPAAAVELVLTDEVEVVELLDSGQAYTAGLAAARPAKRAVAAAYFILMLLDWYWVGLVKAKDCC